MFCSVCVQLLSAIEYYKFIFLSTKKVLYREKEDDKVLKDERVCILKRKPKQNIRIIAMHKKYKLHRFCG